MQLRRYIIFGASGRTGREVCRLAKEKKHYVVAVIRDPEQYILPIPPYPSYIADESEPKSLKRQASTQRYSTSPKLPRTLMSAYSKNGNPT